MRTSEGPIEAVVEGESVRLRYELRAAVESEHRLPGPGGPRRCWLVSIGTPHLVMPVEELPEGPIDPICRPLRHHPGLGPDGANVNLVGPIEGGRARIRTYERGVERETSACGAGCMATTLALSRAGLAAPRLALETRSGEVLTVEVGEEGTGAGGRGPDGSGSWPGDSGIVPIQLEGPARLVFEGRFPDPVGEE